MSRIKRSNKNNEFKKILGLALAIGIAGTATSYAYFSASSKVSSNLKVTMGTLDLNLSCDDDDDYKSLINITGLKPSLKDDDCECETDDGFKIQNTGSLKQKIKIKVDFEKTLPSSVTGRVFLEDGDKKQVSQDIDIKELAKEKFIEVKDLKGNPLVIKPGENLIGKFKIKVKNSIDYKYESKDFDFNITVRGTQVNNKDWLGFE